MGAVFGLTWALAFFPYLLWVDALTGSGGKTSYLLFFWVAARALLLLLLAWCTLSDNALQISRGSHETSLGRFPS